MNPLISVFLGATLCFASAGFAQSDAPEVPLMAGDSLATSADGGQGVKHSSTIAEAFANGSIKGLIRYSAQYRDSNLHVLQDSDINDISNEKKQQYSALGGYLGYETAPWHNTSMGFTFYSSNPIGNNPSDRMGLGGLDESNGEQAAYSVLGEAFLAYTLDDHLLKIGRQEMPNYRFVALSNIRMTPVTHSGVIYETTALKNLKINAAYITQQKDRNATEFEGMVRAARVNTGCGEVDATGDCLDTSKRPLIRGEFNAQDFGKDGHYQGSSKEMLMLGGSYTYDSMNIELWNYWIDDFLNTSYVYAQQHVAINGSEKSLTFAIQYANQHDVGGHVAGNIDTWFYGIKAQFNAPGLTAFIAFNEVAYHENSYDGGSIFVRWGTPQMFNSFQVQDSELAGTQSYGSGFQYDFGHLGLLPGVVMRVRYGVYDMPDDLSQNDARQDRQEYTFDLRYSFSRDSGFGIFTQMQGLSVQLRLAYNDYETAYDFAEYQNQHGYDFVTVTDDFIDARLYVDYQF